MMIAKSFVMKFPFILLTICMLGSCTAQVAQKSSGSTIPEKAILSKADQYFHLNDTIQESSKSKGSVSKGSLINGRIVPFSGNNFHYFDTTSYLADRGFTHENVLATLLDSYASLDTLIPGRHFCIMECSHKHGGQLYPHRTHQNGMSVDFMMPKLKDGQPYYELDNLGAQHYMLTFDKNGRYSKDNSIQLDFNTIALHILQLEVAAKKNGMSIEKVIINTNLKDELFATEYGQILKSSGIYVVRNLSPLINSLHDDHFHIDFKFK